MSTSNPNPKIKIDSVDGGKDGNDLKNCYFQLEEGSTTDYDFYSSSNVLLASDVQSGVAFSFTLDTFTWNMTATITPPTATGTWSNNDPNADKDNWDENGSFQAQATLEEEGTASSATA